jgi:hypothetical protein
VGGGCAGGRDELCADLDAVLWACEGVKASERKRDIEVGIWTPEVEFDMS